MLYFLEVKSNWGRFHRKIMKKVILIIVLFLLFGCESTPQPKPKIIVRQSVKVAKVDPWPEAEEKLKAHLVEKHLLDKSSWLVVIAPELSREFLFTHRYFQLLPGEDRFLIDQKGEILDWQINAEFFEGLLLLKVVRINDLVRASKVFELYRSLAYQDRLQDFMPGPVRELRSGLDTVFVQELVETPMNPPGMPTTTYLLIETDAKGKMKSFSRRWLAPR